MKEPTKTEIARAIIALMELETKSHQGWTITPQLIAELRLVIDDLRFYYQFAPNDKKEGHIPSLAVLSQRVAKD